MKVQPYLSFDGRMRRGVRVLPHGAVGRSENAAAFQGSPRAVDPGKMVRPAPKTR